MKTSSLSFRQFSLFFLIGMCICIGCNVDPCEEIVCENGGTCTEGICECPEGFLGDKCERIDVTRLIGNYDGRYEGCFQTNDEHIVQLDETAEPGFAISIINLGDYACPSNTDGRVRVLATLNGSSIQIPEQLVCDQTNFAGYTFSGSGTVFTDSVRLSFSVSYRADGINRTDDCTAILIKP
ncbi:MAG: hypothetical protein AB8F95_20660 [Bacteroidia bacterium]